MTTEQGSERQSEELGVSAESTVSRRLAFVVVAIFTLQTALTMGAYLNQRTQRLGEVLRVYSSATWLPGGSAAARVGVIDSATTRALPFDGVSLEVEQGEVALGALHDVAGSFGVAHALVPPEASGRVVLSARLGEEEEERRVETSVELRDGVDWLRERSRWRGEGSVRRPNLSVAAGDGPELRVRAAEGGDPCDTDLSVSVGGGVVAVGLDNQAVVRLTRGGVSVVDALVRLSGPEGGASRSARTDVFGSADFTFEVGGVEQWTLAYECEGAEVTRKLDIVPSWDGMVIRPTRAVYSEERTFGFAATHQRTWGEWHQDVYCDGAWLATQTTPILDRVAVLGMPELRIPPRAGGVRLCLVEGYRFLMSPDPPRSVGYFLWAAPGVSRAAAVQTLVEALMAEGSTEVRGQVSASTLAAIPGASTDELERLARWVLDGLPQPFVPIPLAVDGKAAAETRFEARQGRVLQALLLVLLLDAVVLLLGVFGVLIPGALRQRAALRAVVEDMELEGAEEVSGARRGNVVLVVGGLAITASLLGIVVLFSVLQ